MATHPDGLHVTATVHMSDDSSVRFEPVGDMVVVHLCDDVAVAVYSAEQAESVATAFRMAQGILGLNVARAEMTRRNDEAVRDL